MRSLLSLALSLVLVAAPAWGRVNNHYAKWKLGQPYGYRDLNLSPTRWKIRSMSYKAGMDFTVAMALHRVAILAKANGFENLAAVSLKVTCSNLFRAAPKGCVGTALDEEVDIIAVGFNPGNPVPPCEQTGRWAVNCRTVAVDQLLADLRPSLGLTSQQDEQEVATARLESTARNNK